MGAPLPPAPAVASLRAGSPPALWRWAALLGFALITPVALPAGGAERRLPEVRRREVGEPLLPQALLPLQAAPEHRAPTLAQLPSDQPLRILRSWRDRRGERWLRVETMPGPGAGAARRGWLAA